VIFKYSFRYLALASLISILLSGCGGGGGGGGGGPSTSSTSSSTPVSPAPPAGNVVVVNPLISKAPDALAVEEGVDAVFAVVAMDPGKLPLSYQWYRDDKEIPGETKASYVLRSPTVKTDNAARIWVLVKNTTGGRAQSQPVVLTVTTKPPVGAVLTIDSQPKQIYSQPNADVTFSVTLKGGVSPYSYQWKKNNINISGANSPNLSVRATSELSGSMYGVDVVDSKGQSVKSQQVALRIYDLYLSGSFAGSVTSAGGTRQNRTFGAVWKNSVLKTLNPSSSNLIAVTPTDMQLFGNDVYLSANIQTADTPTPAYWKNDQMNSLTLPARVSSGNTSEIFVNSSGIYVSGVCNKSLTAACVWIDGVLSEKDTQANGGNSVMSGVTSVGGSLHFTSMNSSIYQYGNDKKTYWIDSVATDLDAQKLGKIRQFGGKTYTVGRSSAGRPAYWIDGKSGAIELSTEEGEALDIFVENGDIFVGGYTGSLFQNLAGATPRVATTWKKSTNGVVANKLEGSEVYGLVAINGDVFSVGTAKSGKPSYWQNSNPVLLPSDTLPGTTNGIAFKLY